MGTCRTWRAAVLGVLAMSGVACPAGSSARRAPAEADVTLPAATADAGVAPATDRPDGGRRVAGGCASDLDCGGGATCFRCGNGSGTCLATCERSGCPAGSVCRPVQCIRCPCPAQCVPGR